MKHERTDLILNPSPFLGRVFTKDMIIGKDRLGRRYCRLNGRSIKCPPKPEDKLKERQRFSAPDEPEGKQQRGAADTEPQKTKAPQVVEQKEKKPPQGACPVTPGTCIAFEDAFNAVKRQLHLDPGKNGFDLYSAQEGYAFDVRMVCSGAGSYSFKQSPMKLSAPQGFKPALMALVLDTSQGKAWVYWREGLNGGALDAHNLRDWTDAGIVNFPKQEDDTPSIDGKSLLVYRTKAIEGEPTPAPPVQPQQEDPPTPKPVVTPVPVPESRLEN